MILVASLFLPHLMSKQIYFCIYTILYHVIYFTPYLYHIQFASLHRLNRNNTRSLGRVRSLSHLETAQVGKEAIEACEEMISLLEDYLQPRAMDGESAVFFHKMRAVTRPLFQDEF